ncbi:thioesterase family protein, partial [Acinetobacter guillouiae]|nr:thioesterase family protein [Acinetobacter guillouiae]
MKLSCEILRLVNLVSTFEFRLWHYDGVLSILIARFGSLRDSKILVSLEPHAADFPPLDQIN